MERRSLQYTDAKSDKFWTITLEGMSHTVQYGRVGTAGQSQTKAFGSEVEAQKSFQKLLQEKLKKGYVEVEAISEVAQVDEKQPDPVPSRPAYVLDANQDIASTILAQLTQNKKVLCELAALDAIPDAFMPLLDLEIRVAIAQQENTADRIFQHLVTDAHNKVRQALAKNAKAPSHILEQLAKDKSLDVRTALAKNPDAPPQALAQLGKDSYSAVRNAVAKHPNTPGEVLLDMISELPAYNGNSIDRSLWVPRLAAERRYTSPETLAQLANHDDQYVRTFVARHPNTPVSVLEALANDPYSHVRGSVAGNPNASLTLLMQLANNSEWEPQAGVASNLNTPVHLLEQLASRSNAQLNYCIAKNPNASGEILRTIVQVMEPHNLELVAQHSNTPIDILEQLSIDSKMESRVRVGVAKNLSSPDYLLANLASDKSIGGFMESTSTVIDTPNVQIAIASNPNTPSNILVQLAQTKNLFISQALAKNPQLPTALLEQLAETEDFQYDCNIYDSSQGKSFPAKRSNQYQKYFEELLQNLASNLNTPIRVLKQLAKHEAKAVRQAAQATVAFLRRQEERSNPKVLSDVVETYLKPPQSLNRFLVLLNSQVAGDWIEKVSCSTEWHDRYAIAQNPSTSPEILQKLAQDAEPIVQNAAKVALGLEPFVEHPVVQAEIMQASEQTEPAEIAPNTPEQSTVLEKLEIVRSLNLNPEDWLWATWLPRNPAPKPVVKPFVLEDALKRLMKIQGKAPDQRRKQEGYFGLDWSKAKISISLTPQEAHFWLMAMICEMPGSSRTNAYFTEKHLSDLADYVRIQSLTGQPDLHKTCVILLRDWRGIRPQIVYPLANLFSIAEVCIAIVQFQQFSIKEGIQYLETNFGKDYIDRYVAARSHWTAEEALSALVQVTQREASSLLRIIIQGFKDHFWKTLTSADAQLMVEQLRPAFKSLPSGSPLYFLAAYLGMEEVKTYLDTWKVSAGKYLRTDESIEIIFGAGDAQLVEAYARTLWIGLGKPDYIRGWLANTQFGALDWICRSLLKSYPSQTTDLLQAFTESVQAPEAAPYMLELWLKLKKPQLARQWLEDNPTHAIVGLLPIAAGQTVEPVEAKPAELIKAAIAFLSSLKRKGYESLIRLALEQQPPDIIEKVKALVLDQEEADLLPFDEKSTPQWLKEGIADLPSQKRSQQPDWISAADLPVLAVGDRCLSEDQIHACLCALKLSTLDSPLLLVQHLKTHANPPSLDGFIWSLFERWLTEGGSSKEKWAMLALGLLGSDAIALKLTPLIRNWPGENQHPRAVLGLECLRTIGSDTALMQINGIAQKTKYQGLQARAEECMEAVARDRNLTQDQLEDRIIPDCGLDAAGKRVFDFGPRQFYFALGADLKPIVRDEKGKHLTTLPKPSTKDDAEKAPQAIADWKLLKKQVGEIVKIQSVRLEDAMITERRWPWAEFSSLLVQHPLLIHLVQRLIWGTYSPEGILTQTFRVSEDRTYADCRDNAFIPDESNLVGIIHPIDLSEDLKAQWGQTLSDYEIIPPFAQINREVYRLHPEETEAEEILRFKDISIPGEMLAYTMEKFGWQRGGLHDHGDYRVHYKDFDQGKVTAIVGDYECQHVEKSSIWGADAMDGCLFLVDVIREPYEYPAPGSWADQQLKAKRLRLGEVHPLVMSEVLRDLTAIATAAQTQ